MESLEGRRVRISGVTLDTRTPLFPDRGANLALSLPDAAAPVTLRVDGDSRSARVDLAGQPKPVGPFTVVGIWTQNDPTRPFTEGYQILPTRWVDLVPDGRPPEVEWTAVIENPIRFGDSPTNTFLEQVLLPGERIRINAQFSDDQGPIRSIRYGPNGFPLQSFRPVLQRVPGLIVAIHPALPDRNPCRCR